MSIESMNPTHLLVYTIAGYGKSGDDVYIEGSASTQGRQMIADAGSLTNGTSLLNDVTQTFMGKPGDTTTDDLPIFDKDHFYSKQQIMDRQKTLADSIHDDTSSEDVQKIQVKINAWSNANSLNDTQLQIPTGQFNNMNKALQSGIQQDQSNLQAIVGIGSSMVQNITFSANLIQQGFA